jgi:hypothetical protein
MRAVWLILLLTTASCFAQTPTVCPWLSTGSAAEALGGPVQLDLHLDSSSIGTCRFISGSGADQESIEITIGKIDTHACPSDSTRMAGLGNEAVECKRTSAGSQVTGLIAGRVRDVYFAVGIRNPHEDPMAAPPMHRGDPEHPPVLELVAEQVVGNLY